MHVENTIRFVFLAALLSSSPAFAEPFNCAINGHDYDFIPQTCNTSWTSARDDAIAAGGYLVTITSAHEQACLEANAVAGSWWAGGSDAATEQVWEWVTGPEAGRQFWQGGPDGDTTEPDHYAKWFASEPNSSGEDYMVWNTGSGFGWNDVGHTNPIVCGYLIEFDPRPPETVFEDGFEDRPSIARIEVNPPAILFTEIGENMVLQAQAYDASGQLIPNVNFTWASNDDATVSIDGTGLATAQAGLGSAQITANADGAQSAPVTALVAVPAAGAVLVDDSEVVVPPTLVDPNANLEVGLQLFTTLEGKKALEVGDLIIGTGVHPIGGIVVDLIQQRDGTIIVTYEVVPLNDLFSELVLDETYDLSNVPASLGEDAAELYELQDMGNGTSRLTLKPGTSAKVAATTVRTPIEQPNVKFTLGIFECEASVTPPFSLTTNPATIDVSTVATLSVLITVPIGWVPDIELARLDGEIRANFKAGVSLTAKLNAEVKCEAANLIDKTILLVGPTVILSPTVSLGPTIKLGGKIEADSLGFELTAEAKANGFVEYRCPDSTLAPCGANADFNAPTPTADYKIDIPDPDAVANIKIKPELGAGVTGKVSFGLPPSLAVSALLGTLTIEAAKASLGLKQTGDLAFVDTQVEDESYASTYKLAYEWEAGPGAQVEKLLKLISSLFNLEPDLLKFSGGDDLATSPVATSATADVDFFRTGDTVNFTVDLDPNTKDYPFFGYNVHQIKIYRQDTSGDIEEIADVTAAEDQTSFDIPWTADADGSIGTESYYPFVSTDALPIPYIGELELKKITSSLCPGNDISGKWRGMWSGQHPLDGDQVNDSLDLNFTQSGSSLGGEWAHGFSSATSNTSPIASGSYSADTGAISFRVVIERSAGGTETVNFTGTVQCEEGTGNNTRSMAGTHDSGDGAWTATETN